MTLNMNALSITVSSVIMMNVVMLSVAFFIVVLSVVMLNVVMLSVVAPSDKRSSNFTTVVTMSISTTIQKCDNQHNGKQHNDA